MAQVMWFVKQIPQPKILEIGCGKGEMAHYLYDEGFRDYRGFDFSEKALEIARKRVPQEFVCSTVEDQSPYIWDYNLVLCMEVLEHIKDDFAVLDNLKDEVFVILTIPKFDDPAHIRFFRKAKQIRKRYEKYIDIEKIIPINTWFVLWGKMKKRNERKK
jgi:cyclopropane fatty-acyl-phospholipid synthase-like methyltransferase